MFLNAFVFACIGIAFEVAFTAVSEFGERPNTRLEGRSYLWMAPVYALVPLFLDVLYPALRDVTLGGRLALYVCILFVVEYAAGALIRRMTGRCPWDYGDARWSIDGLIRLDYAPFWAGACWAFEALYLALTPVAVT